MPFTFLKQFMLVDLFSANEFTASVIYYLENSCKTKNVGQLRFKDSKLLPVAATSIFAAVNIDFLELKNHSRG